MSTNSARWVPKGNQNGAPMPPKGVKERVSSKGADKYILGTAWGSNQCFIVEPKISKKEFPKRPKVRHSKSDRQLSQNPPTLRVSVSLPLPSIGTFCVSFGRHSKH